MDKTIYFTGSLPHFGEAPFGGGEVGNVRTIKMLESFGYKVVAVRKYRSNAKDSWLKSRLEYPFRTLLNTIKWFSVLLRGTRKEGIAHISGFYGKTIFVETLQAFIAKLLGYKYIYELRGGGATQFYEKGSGFYRTQFRFILNNAYYLFSQGKENEPLLHSLCNTPVYYYPNSVQQGFYPSEMPKRSNDKINLLFFGRIEPDKNPILIIKVATILQKEFGNITLTIVGNGQPSFIRKIKTLVQDSFDSEICHLLPGCTHEDLQKVLRDKHFFVFPSQQEREGQSNALTEAMSYGIIPIASPQGFNRSTIGSDELIVEELSAEAYADRIATIIRNGEFEKYSQFVRQRFLDHYTESVVFESARKIFALLFNV